MMCTRLKTTDASRKLIKLFRANKLYRLCFSTSSNEEYTEKPEYPPILDLSPKEVKRREIQSEHEKYLQLHTVEEKLFAINLPRYYGWDSIILKEGNLPYNVLPFMQYITKTKFIETINLPLTSSNTDIPEDLFNNIRSQIQEAIILELINRRHNHDISEEKPSETTVSDILTKSVVEQINRILLSALSSNFPHLQDAEIDFDPRLEAFWKVGNFPPDNELYKKRKDDLKKQKEEKKKQVMKSKEEKEIDPDEPVEHWIQYFGEPCVQLRHSLPLSPLTPSLPKLVSKTEDEVSVEAVESISKEVVLNVPNHRYDPGFYGFLKDKRHGTNIPGFWPGDPSEFGLLSYHTRGHLLGRPPHFGAKDSQDALHAQGILAGYSWLLSQAAYQGFNTYNELTYPLTTSTVITDGRMFSFYTSQLNTLLLHADYMDTNAKENICYGTRQMELYKHIDGGQILGWNDATLKTLLSFYTNVPSERDGVNLKPYVHGSERYLRDIEDEKRRVWLHNQFRHMYANRPRKLLPYEIYDWENIYKIKFETRPSDARRRPFELGQDPLVDRKYSDHVPKYIKKSFRDPKKRRQKFEDTYYPKV